MRLCRLMCGGGLAPPLSIIPLVSCRAMPRHGGVAARLEGMSYRGKAQPFRTSGGTAAENTEFAICVETNGVCFSLNDLGIYSFSMLFTWRSILCGVWLLLAAVFGLAQTPRPALLIQSGHTQPVSALALSPDGKTVATVSADRTARLWDAATGRELRVLRLDSTPLNVAFSNDGKLLRSGAQVWQVMSGQQITASGEFPAAVPPATGPGRYGLLLIVADGAGLILNVPQMKPEIIASARVSNDGAWLATNSADTAQVKVWDTARGVLVSSIAGRTPVFSADNKTLAAVSGPEMASVTTLNLATKQTSTFGRKAAGSLAAAFSADGKWLAVATNDRQIKLWDLVSGREVGTFGDRKSVV